MDYEKFRTTLLIMERQLIEDVLASIYSSWSDLGVSNMSYGWIDMRGRPLVNAITLSPKGAMFLKVEYCLG